MTRSFRLEADYPYPVDKVWNALTDPKQMGLWIMNFDQDPGEMTTDFNAVAGTAYRMDARKGRGWRGYVVGDVVEVVPKMRLVITWAHGTYQDTHPARIEFALEATANGDGTHVRMTQTGFPGLRGWFVMLGAKLGWKKMLKEGLLAVLEMPERGSA